ncbi:MAG: LamG domain-containing protein [Planctomycetota bacterium]|nr:LamG domain-containing protein [Planctomycetota bacterium]
MKFYYCEKCGARLTEHDLEAGAARDKKLRGVFCADCAAGIVTLETLPLNESQARKLVQQADAAQAQPPTPRMPHRPAPAPRAQPAPHPAPRATKWALGLASALAAAVFSATVLFMASASRGPAAPMRQPDRAADAPPGGPAEESAPARGLILHLDFNDRVQDASPLAQEVSWQDGQAAFDAGPFGRALRFAAQPARSPVPKLLVRAAPPWSNLRAFTISFWISPARTERAQFTVFKIYPFASLELADDALCLRAGRKRLVFPAPELFDGRWRHAVLVWDGERVTARLDGAPLACSDPLLERLSQANVGILVVGGDRDQENGFVGALDELRLYDRALSPAECERLFRH